MRKLILCIFAMVALLQAVEALECYDCPNGGRCFSTATCESNQDRCITLFFSGVGFNPPRFAKRCGTQYECDVISAMGGSSVRAVCCGYDLCNR